jgi:hypothetical protein
MMDSGKFLLFSDKKSQNKDLFDWKRLVLASDLWPIVLLLGVSDEV